MAKWYEKIRDKIHPIEGSMSPVNSWTTGGNIVDAFTGKDAADAAEEAARLQAESGQSALDFQKQMYERGRGDMAPWLETGTRGLGNLESAMNSGQFDMAPESFNASRYQMPQGMDDFSFTMDDFQDSPYYQFLQDEGAKNVNRSAAAGGRLGGGDTLNALQQRGQMTAMNEFGNQYNRAIGGYGANMSKYQTDLNRAQADRGFGYQNFLGDYNRRLGNKQNQFNRMASMADVGQVQSGQMGGMGERYGQQAGNLMTGIGNAQAAGQMGAANAYGQGAQNIASGADMVMSWFGRDKNKGVGGK